MQISLSGRSPILAALAIIAGLGACERNDGLFADRSTMQVAPVVAAAAPDAYLGRWAASATDCGSAPWIFESARLTGPSGVWCETSQVDPSTAGFSLTLMCHGQGATPGRMLVTFSDASVPDRITVEGGPFTAPAPLMRCAGGASGGLTASG